MNYPKDIPLEEFVLLLPANNVPRNVPGVWDFVGVLTSTNDVQEVSFNDGSSWVKLRKGIKVRIPGSTSGLMLRNPSGADITVTVAVGLGDFDDNRLVVGAGAGTIDVNIASQTAGAITQLPAALVGGKLAVTDTGRPDVVGTGVKGKWAATNAAVAATPEVLVAAATNVAGLRITQAGVIGGPAAVAECAEIYAEGAGGMLLLAGSSGPYSSPLSAPVTIPAGYAIKAVSTSAPGNQRYLLGWEVL